MGMTSVGMLLNIMAIERCVEVCRGDDDGEYIEG